MQAAVLTPPAPAPAAAMHGVSRPGAHHTAHATAERPSFDTALDAAEAGPVARDTETREHTTPPGEPVRASRRSRPDDEASPVVEEIPQGRHAEPSAWTTWRWPSSLQANGFGPMEADGGDEVADVTDAAAEGAATMGAVPASETTDDVPVFGAFTTAPDGTPAAMSASAATAATDGEVNGEVVADADAAPAAATTVGNGGVPGAKPGTVVGAAPDQAEGLQFTTPATPSGAEKAAAGVEMPDSLAQASPSETTPGQPHGQIQPHIPAPTLAKGPTQDAEAPSAAATHQTSTSFLADASAVAPQADASAAAVSELDGMGATGLNEPSPAPVLEGAARADASPMGMPAWRRADMDAAVQASQPAATAQPAEQALVVDQVVKSLRVQWKQGLGEARILLRPEHLGPVDVAIKVEGGAVTAVVRAESAQVQEWLLSNQQSLRQQLEAAGLRLDDLVVSRDGERRRQQREADREDVPRRGRSRHDGAGQPEPIFSVVV